MASIRSIVWAARARHLSTLAPDEVMELIRADADIHSDTPGFIALPSCEVIDNSPDVEYIAHVNVAHISSVVPCFDGAR